MSAIARRALEGASPLPVPATNTPQLPAASSHRDAVYLSRSRASCRKADEPGQVPGRVALREDAGLCVRLCPARPHVGRVCGPPPRVLAEKAIPTRSSASTCVRCAPTYGQGVGAIWLYQLPRLHVGSRNKMTPRPRMSMRAGRMRLVDAVARTCSLAHHATHEGRRYSSAVPRVRWGSCTSESERQRPRRRRLGRRGGFHGAMAKQGGADVDEQAAFVGDDARCKCQL